MEELLRKGLKIELLEIEDESYKHLGHVGNKERKLTGTHFHMKIISDDFSGKSLIQRHRIVHDILRDYVGGKKIHALSLDLKTLAESSGSA